MSTALHRQVSDDLGLAGSALTALLVGATLYLVDGSPGYAAASAAVFFALHLSTDVAEAIIGDYAGNALFGLLILAATGYAVTLTTPLWLPFVGASLGGWYLLDGVQHLRYGVSRETVSVPSRHEGSVLTGLPKALLARLLAPLVLHRTDGDDTAP